MGICQINLNKIRNLGQPHTAGPKDINKISTDPASFNYSFATCLKTAQINGKLLIYIV